VDDKVSCLCVTEGREAFMPWLISNYRKQDHPRRELVIVDSSREPFAPPDDPSVRVLRCPPGTSVARKRNLAVDAARGTLLTWFDDDDWQHPRKLSILAAALGDGGVLAGSLRSWFIDLRHGRARPYEARRSVIFNGAGVRRTALDGVRFDERRARAADTAWMTAVRRSGVRVVPEILSCWLCHAGNVSNPAARYAFPYSLDDVRRAVGAEAWGETDEELSRLRARTGGTGTRPTRAARAAGARPAARTRRR
jgi:hypothetical protein